MTQIGIISDTHGNQSYVQRVVALLKQMRIQRIIHCGDVGPNVISLLGEFQADFVPGNTDDVCDLRYDIIEPHHALHPHFGSVEIEGKRIAFMHGDDVRLLRQTVQSGEWDLVCHGHTHTFSNSSNGTTRVLNPGALQRTSRPSFAVVTLPALEVREVLVASD